METSGELNRKSKLAASKGPPQPLRSIPLRVQKCNLEAFEGG